MAWCSLASSVTQGEHDAASRQTSSPGAGRGPAEDRHPGGSDGVTRKLRCAVYTRKSSEEGLEIEFNSLDAQREACEAYIASQRWEGWVPRFESAKLLGLS
jgi:site-specific DNA recombinase